ncbi:MAG: S49 family peptidase [Pseudomonadota bacterium]
MANAEKPRNEENPQAWERKLMEKLVLAGVTERRRARRWGIFFKFLIFAYLFLLLGIGLWDGWTDNGLRTADHVALVEIDGIIASADLGVDADLVVDSLKDAFKDDHTKGVIIRINSPGGSPVQSAEINAEIIRLREKHSEIPVYAVVSDVCASGGYYVAAATEKIYANRSSIVGSIGVLMNQFGFVDTMDKLGVERRLLTAGERKGIFDPFSPLTETDKRHAEQLLGQIHALFIQAVKDGRGDRLSDREDVFSGLFWTGEESLELGLIDGFGDARHVAREVIGVEKLVDFTREEDIWERLARRLGTGAGAALARALGWNAGTLVE